MLCCGVVLCVAVSLLTQTSGTQPWLVRKRDELANDAIASDTDLTLAFRSHAVALCSHHRWCACLPACCCLLQALWLLLLTFWLLLFARMP